MIWSVGAETLTIFFTAALVAPAYRLPRLFESLALRRCGPASPSVGLPPAAR